jgi:hypothetical protein
MLAAWNNEDSVLSPLIIGIHPEVSDPKTVVERCFRVSAMSVPLSVRTEQVRVKNSLKSAPERVIRRTLVKYREDGLPHPYTARLVDQVNGRTALLGNSIWEVGLAAMEPGAALPAIDSSLTTFFVEVVLTKLNGTGILGYSELALFRHMLVSNLKTYDAELVVFGGQREFSDHWWQRAQAPSLSTYAAHTSPQASNVETQVSRRTCPSNHPVADDQQFCDQCGVRL